MATPTETKPQPKPDTTKANPGPNEPGGFDPHKQAEPRINPKNPEPSAVETETEVPIGAEDPPLKPGPNPQRDPHPRQSPRPPRQDPIPEPPTVIPEPPAPAPISEVPHNPHPAIGDRRPTDRLPDDVEIIGVTRTKSNDKSKSTTITKTDKPHDEDKPSHKPAVSPTPNPYKK